MDSKIIKYFLISIFIFSNTLAVEFNGKFIQGHYIIGKTDPNSTVTIDKTKVKVSKDGYFAFGLDRERKYDVVIKIKKDGSTNKIIKKVQKRKYNIQRIDGLEEKKVTPPEEVYERIKNENKLIAKAREINSDLDFFKDKFILPLENAIITGVYGSQRILNGKPRWPHYGIDFAGDLGTPIKAMADGIVTLSENDLYFTGATLIFDHGHGISTLYMHLDEIFVEKGDIAIGLPSSGPQTNGYTLIRKILEKFTPPQDILSQLIAFVYFLNIIISNVSNYKTVPRNGN